MKKNKIILTIILLFVSLFLFVCLFCWWLTRSLWGTDYEVPIDMNTYDIELTEETYSVLKNISLANEKYPDIDSTYIKGRQSFGNSILFTNDLYRFGFVDPEKNIYEQFTLSCIYSNQINCSNLSNMDGKSEQYSSYIIVKTKENTTLKGESVCEKDQDKCNISFKVNRNEYGSITNYVSEPIIQISKDIYLKFELRVDHKEEKNEVIKKINEEIIRFASLVDEVNNSLDGECYKNTGLSNFIVTEETVSSEDVNISYTLIPENSDTLNNYLSVNIKTKGNSEDIMLVKEVLGGTDKTFTDNTYYYSIPSTSCKSEIYESNQNITFFGNLCDSKTNNEETDVNINVYKIKEEVIDKYYADNLPNYPTNYVIYKETDGELIDSYNLTLQCP